MHTREETITTMTRGLEIRTCRTEHANFYGSDDWKFGPRAELIDRIETYMSTLIFASESAIADMKALNRSETE